MQNKIASPLLSAISGMGSWNGLSFQTVLQSSPKNPATLRLLHRLSYSSHHKVSFCSLANGRGNSSSEVTNYLLSTRRREHKLIMWFVGTVVYKQKSFYMWYARVRPKSPSGSGRRKYKWGGGRMRGKPGRRIGNLSVQPRTWPFSLPYNWRPCGGAKIMFWWSSPK